MATVPRSSVEHQGYSSRTSSNRCEYIERRTRNEEDLAVSREKILLSREFLKACLEERVSQEGPVVLDDKQRQFLEAVATSATFDSDVVAVGKDLLEAFLAAE
jgi:uncharacterized protein YbcC (UPF0753/DUF2309 family)